MRTRNFDESHKTRNIDELLRILHEKFNFPLNANCSRDLESCMRRLGDFDEGSGVYERLRTLATQFLIYFLHQILPFVYTSNFYNSYANFFDETLKLSYNDASNFWIFENSSPNYTLRAFAKKFSTAKDVSKRIGTVRRPNDEATTNSPVLRIGTIARPTSETLLYSANESGDSRAADDDLALLGYSVWYQILMWRETRFTEFLISENLLEGEKREKNDFLIWAKTFVKKLISPAEFFLTPLFLMETSRKNGIPIAAYHKILSQSLSPHQKVSLIIRGKEIVKNLFARVLLLDVLHAHEGNASNAVASQLGEILMSGERVEWMEKLMRTNKKFDESNGTTLASLVEIFLRQVLVHRWASHQKVFLISIYLLKAGICEPSHASNTTVVRICEFAYILLALAFDEHEKYEKFLEHKKEKAGVKETANVFLRADGEDVGDECATWMRTLLRTFALFRFEELRRKGRARHWRFRWERISEEKDAVFRPGDEGREEGEGKEETAFLPAELFFIKFLLSDILEPKEGAFRRGERDEAVEEERTWEKIVGREIETPIWKDFDARGRKFGELVKKMHDDANVRGEEEAIKKVEERMSRLLLTHFSPANAQEENTMRIQNIMNNLFDANLKCSREQVRKIYIGETIKCIFDETAFDRLHFNIHHLRTTNSSHDCSRDQSQGSQLIQICPTIPVHTDFLRADEVFNGVFTSPCGYIFLTRSAPAITWTPLSRVSPQSLWSNTSFLSSLSSSILSSLSSLSSLSPITGPRASISPNQSSIMVPVVSADFRKSARLLCGCRLVHPSGAKFFDEISGFDERVYSEFYGVRREEEKRGEESKGEGDGRWKMEWAPDFDMRHMKENLTTIIKDKYHQNLKQQEREAEEMRRRARDTEGGEQEKEDKREERREEEKREEEKKGERENCIHADEIANKLIWLPGVRMFVDTKHQKIRLLHQRKDTANSLSEERSSATSLGEETREILMENLLRERR